MTMLLWLACIVLAPFALLVAWIAFVFICSSIWCLMLGAHEALRGGKI